MKKMVLSFTVFLASAAYVVYQYLGGGSSVIAADQTASTATTSPVAQQPAVTTPVATTQTTPAQTTTATTPVTTPTPTSTSKPKGQYVDGTYVGSSADAYYGTVQVQATIQDGKLADVTFLQYPSDRRTSQYINSQAMPQLRQEAIQAQSADVSGVSGASDTSAAFRESLAVALSQAKS